MDDPKPTISEFKELFTLRENLAAQQSQASEITAPVYDEAVENANAQLKELAQEAEVQNFLLKLGGTAVQGFMEMKELERSGRVSTETLEAKQAEFDKLRQKPVVRMALEFLSPDNIPEVIPAVTKKLATPKQLTFAKVLELDITEETPIGVASKMIKREVLKRSKAELKNGSWHIYSLVEHPKYGPCEIDKIHEKIGKVTLKPLDGRRCIVVAAMNLPNYKTSE